jgi:2-keto-4-pentenoate hydratase
VSTAQPPIQTLETAANLLWSAAQTRKPCSPVRELLKDGLTSTVVQKQLGVDQPDYGMLFADMAVADGEQVSLSRLIQPKIEGEIAFVMGRDLDVSTPTIADVLRAVDFALPAIEIVDSRIKNWDIRLVDTIADNGSAGMYVLGTQPKLLRDLDLVQCGMVMERHGEAVSFGSGKACLGNPLAATLWLAANMVRVGRPLKAGDTIISGALGPMISTAPGDQFEVRISQLGSVRVTFA